MCAGRQTSTEPERMSRPDNAASLRDALRRIADNLWFTWLGDARTLFGELDAARFDALDHNPTALLAELSDAQLEAAVSSPELVERVESVLAAFGAEAARPTWWQGSREDDRFSVAYFSTEFGLDESLPIYSGGLGVLAGDHLKSASDLGIPLVAVGLFYAHGYFLQRLDGDGWQREEAPAVDVTQLPLEQV